MTEEDPNHNKMSVERIEGTLIQVRNGFSELRSSDVDQMEALDDMNTALYKLERSFSDVKEVF